MSKISLCEQTASSILELVEEKTATGTVKVRGEFGRVDVPTANGRKYPRKIVESAINKILPDLKERKNLGQLNHPSDGRANLFEVSHLVTDLRITDEGVVIGEAEIIPGTPGGDIMMALIKARVNVGVSSRGTGSVKTIDEGVQEVQDDFVLNTYDFVIDPAMRTAFPKVVSESLDRLEQPLTEASLQNYIDAVPSEFRTAVLTEMVSKLDSASPELSVVIAPLKEGYENQIKGLNESLAGLSASRVALEAQVSELTEGKSISESKALELTTQLESINAQIADLTTKRDLDVQALTEANEKLAKLETEHKAQVEALESQKASEIEKAVTEAVATQVESVVKVRVEDAIAPLVEAKLSEVKAQALVEAREGVQKEFEADPRNALARKLLEEVAEKFAPLVAGPHSPMLQEAQERIRALRDALMVAEFDAATLAEKLDTVSTELAEARFVGRTWESIATHPKADVLHEMLIGVQTEAALQARLEKLLKMPEFGTVEEAREKLIEAKAKQIVEATMKEVEKQFDAKLNEAQDKITDLRGQVEKAREAVRITESKLKGKESELTQANELSVSMEKKLQQAVDIGLNQSNIIDENKKTHDALKAEVNQLEAEKELVEAKVEALRAVMANSNRLALAESIVKSKTKAALNSLDLRQTLNESRETESRPAPRTVERRSAPVQEQVTRDESSLNESEDSAPVPPVSMFNKLLSNK